jgi:hypothetical protein
MDYRPLTSEEIEQLEGYGCTADDWARVQVVPEFTTERLRHVRFSGDVRLGRLHGVVESGTGLEKPSVLSHAYLANCSIGDGVRIVNIGSHIAGYDIGDSACIEDVGALQTSPGATFGNGVEVEALNEGGGREVTLFDELSAQFAYLQCVVRWRPKLTERLDVIARKATTNVQSNQGTIGRNAKITSVDRIENVNIGEAANVNGALAITNGTILSSADAPTWVGPGVMAEDFIIAEGANVCSGSILSKAFVGQGCQIGKQFSAEGSLFFANCEGFHGEACSVFAGPYTVTHHKSTLLIAGLFSFYNAGSGTNQSNHMYKLGPVHEGKLERGCKTGSFSYLMWPCRVGPFSVVLGKHTRSFDTRDFPFSHIEAKADGRCEMIPGLYLSTVGTVRDGAKWPIRDRRQGAVKRDFIDFDVLSPLTVGRMLRGSEVLRGLAKSTDKAKKTVVINGAAVRRVLLRTGVKYYQAGIEMYLQERLVSRAEAAHARGETDPTKALAVANDALLSEEWIDLAGQMMPEARFAKLCERIESGAVESVAQVHAALSEIHDAYAEDEWAWVVWAYEKHFGKDVTAMTADDVRAAATGWRDVRTKFLKLILGDAEKEFARLTRTGFGICPSEDELAADFTAVRGTFDSNKFVGQVREEIAEVERRAVAIE